MLNIIKSEIQVKNLELFYGENKALKNISIDIEAKKGYSINRTFRVW